MRIVGTNHGGYANERNIAGLPLTRYRVVRSRNIYRAANFLHFKLRGNMHAYFPYLHWDGGLANYDLLHFFNGISLGRRPWLSTFETFLPRWGAYGGERIRWGLGKLAAPPCKRLIALSQCTHDIQAQFLAAYPEFAEAIMAKVSILHPAQRLLLSRSELETKLEANAHQNQLKCLFVGADFFRKGGLETVKAVCELIRLGAPIQLTVVSAMHFGDYASQTDKEDLTTALQLIAAHPQQIHLHRNLSNAEVLRLACAADIGFLPTWADTYGYSALEFMAAGCPVISTDIRALAEINGPDRGWVFECAKDSWGNAVKRETKADRNEFSISLQAGIAGFLHQILENRALVASKGRAAYAHVEEHHAPTKAAAILETWYDEALNA